MQFSNPIGPERVVPVWYVPIAVALWSISIFLLYQGAAFFKWVAKGGKTAPNARAGIALAWVLSGGSFIFFFFQSPLADHEILPLGLVTFLSRDPEAFSQALLFASLPIGVFAAYKFLVTVSLARSTQIKASSPAQSPVALLVGGIFTLLQLAGSIASLIAIFR